MIPQQLKKAFGLNDKKDMNMANNIWKMLDDMANSDPEQYKQFVNKNINEGFTDMKQKKQEKEKPFKVKPNLGFSLTLSAKLCEKLFQNEINTKILITKQPWDNIKKQFSQSITIHLNIMYSNRVRPSVSKSTKQPITQYSISNYKDIELFYYSLQGPEHQSQHKNILYYCMILNQTMYLQLMKENNGKKVILALCVSYLEERLQNDKNPLLKVYNPQQYRRLAYYAIDKYSIEISEKNYNYLGRHQAEEFLLEKQVDTNKQRQQAKKQQVQKQQKKMKPEEPVIRFKHEQKQPQQPLSALKVSNEPQPKPSKVLIQVLKEEMVEVEEVDDNIPYQMKQTEFGYSFSFLLNGVSSIKEVDLEMKTDSLRLKVKDKKQLVISLKRGVNDQTIKAKLKKKEKTLIVEASFK